MKRATATRRGATRGGRGRGGRERREEDANDANASASANANDERKKKRKSATTRARSVAESVPASLGSLYLTFDNCALGDGAARALAERMPAALTLAIKNDIFIHI